MSKHNQYVFKNAVRDAMFVGYIATRANSSHNLLMVGATSVYFAFVGPTFSLDSSAESNDTNCNYFNRLYHHLQ